MADNYNLSVAASELNAAITKANASAPQSTTYTRAQVDAAIASEASARQAAVDAKASISDIYGVKPTIPNGTDLDTMQTPGAYACGGAGTAATLINCPTTTEAFIMYVDHIAATTRIIQRLYAMNTGTGVPCVYIRALYGSGWGAWYKFEGTAVST